MRDLRKLMEKQEFASVEDANAYLQNLLRSTGGVIPHPEPETPLERAEEVANAAELASTRAARAKLARQALSLSPDCASALLVLVEDEDHPVKKLALLEQAVAAGYRAIGPESFVEYEREGAFWGMIETRPYMRAASQWAELVWVMGNRRGAITEFQRLLKLNPGDNQGLRYMLAFCLLEEQTESARATLDGLLAAYPDDAACSWDYSRALLAFQRHGPSPKSNAALKHAIKANRFVPAYLLGDKDLPDEMPSHIGFGDQSEAVDYVGFAVNAWAQTPGAIAWLSQLRS